MVRQSKESGVAIVTTGGVVFKPMKKFLVLEHPVWASVNTML
ncbi:MAG: hypothetical protein R2784_05555 [Saprospiraceae bacterium]